MFKRKTIGGLRVKISICKDVLDAIFDECDLNNINETGGRIVGYYRQNGNKLNIKACGFIGPGPNARRSPASFFQDGEYQEEVFRKIEAKHPKIEHLGNWHTHHVNSLDTLSSGDVDTYKRIVNHEKHNTDFFYALLVIAKNHTFSNRERYSVKHFLLKRGESLIYEIPSSQIKIIKEAARFIDKAKAIEVSSRKENLTDLISSQPMIDYSRARDKEFISEIYPGMNPFFSKKTESLYWRGKLNLIDNSSLEVLVLESVNKEGKPSYSINLSASFRHLFQCSRLYLKRTFDSAWKAIYLLEQDLNREVFEKVKK